MVGHWRRRDRDEDDGDQGQRDRHDADRREPIEPASQDRRPERIADDHDAHLEQGRRVRGPEVGAHDERHTRDADEHPDQARPGRTGPRRRSPSAIAAPTSGTPAMSSPASELEMCCSADPSATHGMAISTAANATTQRQRASTWRRSVRTRANGSRMAAAMSRPPEHQRRPA